MVFPPRTLANVRSPKLSSTSGRWYRYYAGFAPEFVDDILDAYAPQAAWNILDPWMGSGTTLAVGAARGYQVAGVDLNPAMVVVAKGRLIANDTIKSIDTLSADLLRHWRPASPDSADPLRHWFDAVSTRQLRGLINRVNRVLVSNTPGTAVPADVTGYSSLACLYYVALFDLTTSALKRYLSQNPTWLKRAENYDGEVALTRAEIGEGFTKSVEKLLLYRTAAGGIDLDAHDAAQINQGDTKALPYADDSFDFVISSPPYLTRLDYVMGHAPELAVLGWDGEAIRRLRGQMIGTPTMNGNRSPNKRLGARAELTLEAIANHGSYAAKSYYEPNSRQYFNAMADAFDEIDRVTKPGSDIIMVVQDSRFKDVHIDLAACLQDLGKVRGWESGPQKNFQNVRSMAQLNTKAHKIARTTKPVESIITFTTAR
jgi:DNA modification methylase